MRPTSNTAERIEVRWPTNYFFRCPKALNLMEAATLAIETQWNRRVVREAIEIKLAGAALNKDVGKYFINPIWDPVLRDCK